MRERARQRAEEREKQGGGGTKYQIEGDFEFFEPSKGENLINIIPYVVSVDNHPEGIPKGEIWYQRSILVHYGIGADEKPYICPKTNKKACPICDHRAELMKDPDADEELIKELRPREREVFNVLVDDEILLWEISIHNFGNLLEEEIRYGDETAAGALVSARSRVARVRSERGRSRCRGSWGSSGPTRSYRPWRTARPSGRTSASAST